MTEFFLDAFWASSDLYGGAGQSTVWLGMEIVHILLPSLHVYLQIVWASNTLK